MASCAAIGRRADIYGGLKELSIGSSGLLESPQNIT